jgi:hypothetical protein
LSGNLEKNEFSKYDIYKNFTYLQYFNEVKRIQDDYSEILEDYWDLLVNENDIYDHQNL